MSEIVRRMLDDGGPFHMWASETCGHGVYVEMPLDRLDDGDDVTLVLRAAERLNDYKLRADVERIAATFSLSTRQWTADDDRAARFLDEHPWLSDAIDNDRLGWLRERQRRAIAQRDRSLPPHVLDRFERGSMVAYDRLLPNDWDLIVTHDRRSYWAVDQHCLNPSCSCSSIVVFFYVVGDAGSGAIGDARLDLREHHRAPTASSPLAKTIFNLLWERSASELVRRRDEVRRAVLQRLVPQAAAVTVPPRRPVGRNEACPCGSGKKYKRCCSDPAPTRAP